MIIVNGSTWPFHTFEQRRYRFRLLNGCDSRFLILDFGSMPAINVWIIGSEGGVLAAPVNMTEVNANQILIGPSEKADVIVDFTNVPVGQYVLKNVGPDAPFNGTSDEVAEPQTTGQIMQFRIIPALAPEPTTTPENLMLPAMQAVSPEMVTRFLALLEHTTATFVNSDLKLIQFFIRQRFKTDTPPLHLDTTYTPRAFSRLLFTIPAAR